MPFLQGPHRFTSDSASAINFRVETARSGTLAYSRSISTVRVDSAPGRSRIFCMGRPGQVVRITFTEDYINRLGMRAGEVYGLRRGAGTSIINRSARTHAATRYLPSRFCNGGLMLKKKNAWKTL